MNNHQAANSQKPGGHLRAAAAILFVFALPCAGHASGTDGTEDPRVTWGRERIEDALRISGYTPGAINQSVRIEARGRVVLDGDGFPGMREIVLSGCPGEAVPITVSYDHPKGSNPFLQVEWNQHAADFTPIPSDALRHSDQDRTWAGTALLLREL